jgi:hypothetical protein
VGGEGERTCELGFEAVFEVEFEVFERFEDVCGRDGLAIGVLRVFIRPVGRVVVSIGQCGGEWGGEMVEVLGRIAVI